MTRPLRIEFPGALVHLTSRGDRREPIFAGDADRLDFLDVLALGCERFDADVHAYCLMGNHYHLVLATRQGKLSGLMRHLNGVYTQRFNQRHGKVGHVFQGRFKAILVDRDAYLLAVCRYVDLNPVRARMVATPGDWPWSSYRALTGAAEAPDWLGGRTLHALLIGREPLTTADWRAATQRYAAWVEAGRDVRLWDAGLRQQIYLGDDRFVEQMQARADARRLSAEEVPRAQRAAAQPLTHWLAICPTREEAARRAHREGGMTMAAIGRELGLSGARVSQLIARAEGAARTG
jgi:REP element-mobilizing transposase RayT